MSSAISTATNVRLVLLGLMLLLSSCSYVVVDAFQPTAATRQRARSMGEVFVPEHHPMRRAKTTTTTSTSLFGLFDQNKSNNSPSNTGKLSKLPAGISPFEKSLSKSLDVQGNFRKLAATAINQAMRDSKSSSSSLLLEVDFPPLLGGDQSKSAFDDFDNLSELDANRDWCVQLAPLLQQTASSSCWLVLPDDKECELAQREWGGGQLYKRAAKFTSLRAAVLQAAAGDESQYSKAWGSSIASAFDKLTGGDGILADSSTLDDLSSAAAAADGGSRFHLVCQPGNGGPVEDWNNVERLHKASLESGITATTTCVVNGALDKVRDGYYPGVFFPALAKTVPFYKQFDAALVLKPISHQGLYGWLYRVYPEPWQVILQTPVRQVRGRQETVTVQETVALVSQQRPAYADIVQALVRTAETVTTSSK